MLGWDHSFVPKRWNNVRQSKLTGVSLAKRILLIFENCELNWILNWIELTEYCSPKRHQKDFTQIIRALLIEILKKIESTHYLNL